MVGACLLCGYVLVIQLLCTHVINRALWLACRRECGIARYLVYI